MTARSRRRRRGGVAGSVIACRRPWLTTAFLPALPMLLAACSLLQSPERSFVTNRDLLVAASRSLGFEVDPETFTLVAADIRDDVVTLQYTGKAHPGDQSWVMRFSEKSTEQDTIALSDAHPMVLALSEGRRRFEVIEQGERDLAGQTARYVEYTFESPLRGPTGQALVGRGFLVVVRTESPDGPLIYQIKLDNYGDRDDLAFEDLDPLLAPLRPE